MRKYVHSLAPPVNRTPRRSTQSPTQHNAYGHCPRALVWTLSLDIDITNTHKVLIVDEFGIWPYDRESATASFTQVSARYERGSIILTSIKGFAEWGNSWETR